MNELTTGAIVSFSWERYKGQWVSWIKLGVIYVLVTTLINMLVSIIQQGHTTPDALILVTSLASFVVSIFIQVMVIGASLQVYRTGDFTIADLTKSTQFSWNYFLAMALMIILIIAGLICLIIPGIILALRLSLTKYYVIDKGMGPIEALKASAAATKGHLGLLIVNGLASFGIALLGLLALLVGLVAAVPVIMLMEMKTYDLLATKMRASSPSVTA